MRFVSKLIPLCLNIQYPLLIGCIFLPQFRYFRLDSLELDLKAFSELLALFLEVSSDLSLVLEISFEFVGCWVVDGAVDVIEFFDKA